MLEATLAGMSMFNRTMVESNFLRSRSLQEVFRVALMFRIKEGSI